MTADCQCPGCPAEWCLKGPGSQHCNAKLRVRGTHQHTKRCNSCTCSNDAHWRQYYQRLSDCPCNPANQHLMPRAVQMSSMQTPSEFPPPSYSSSSAYSAPPPPQPFQNSSAAPPPQPSQNSSARSSWLDVNSSAPTGGETQLALVAPGFDQQSYIGSLEQRIADLEQKIIELDEKVENLTSSAEPED